jgi:hypothetical protein
MKTLKHLSLPVLSFALLVILMSGCKKDKDDNKNSSRNVKYELSGTYTGKFSVIITDTESGQLVIDNVSIPWSKEVSYSDKVLAVGIGAAAVTDGSAGQTALLKIYSGGNVVKTTNGTADQNGVLTLPALAHTF